MIEARAFKTIDTTIASGQSLSAAIVFGGYALHGIAMPSGWDAADLTFQVSVDGGSNYLELRTPDQIGFQYPAAAGQFISLTQRVLYGFNMLKVRSGTATLAVAQTADRTLKLIVQPIA